jgi:hypothetical protein
MVVHLIFMLIICVAFVVVNTYALATFGFCQSAIFTQINDDVDPCESVNNKAFYISSLSLGMATVVICLFYVIIMTFGFAAGFSKGRGLGNPTLVQLANPSRKRSVLDALGSQISSVETQLSEKYAF